MTDRVEGEAKTAAAEIPISEVHETDVLVIGSGIAGLTAAIAAADNGADVIIVDKGPLARSGSSGMNWGNWSLSELDNPEAAKNPDELFQFLFYMSRGIGNQPMLRNWAERIYEFKTALWTENTGSLCRRVPPDTVAFIPGTTMVMHALYPSAMAQESKRRGIRVFDRTMITRLLKYEEAVVGATGVNIENGSLIVFRAKSTIMATGAYGQIYGWVGVSGFTAAQPECTGDGHALLYYAGAELSNMEFSNGEFRPLHPATLAGSFGSVVGSPISTETRDCVCNKDGEYFLKDIPEEELITNLNYELLYGALAKQIREGKGGPRGGVFFDVKESLGNNQYESNFVRLKETLGWDAYEEPVEVAPCMFEFGMNSVPQILINDDWETTVPGLYAVGLGGVSFDFSAWGLQAGKHAAERATKIGRQGIDFDQVNGENQRVSSVLGNAPSDPIRPHIIRHRLQQLAPKYIGLDRTDEGLKKCIAEIERIRKEDVPRMCVSTKTRVWNREFFEALELEFMLDVLEMVARSALMRTESRLTHFRPDYPERDNENWLANIYVKRVDGKMILEKKPVVWTEIPPEQIKEMLK